MKIYSDRLCAARVQRCFRDTGLSRDGVYLELHGPFTARKRRRRFEVKLSADHGRDRFGTIRRWANSGRWGAQTPTNGFVGEPLGDKAATYDEWGVFIQALFALDPQAVIGHYNSPADLNRAWTEPTPVNT